MPSPLGNPIPRVSLSLNPHTNIPPQVQCVTPYACMLREHKHLLRLPLRDLDELLLRASLAKLCLIEK